MPWLRTALPGEGRLWQLVCFAAVVCDVVRIRAFFALEKPAFPRPFSTVGRRGVTCPCGLSLTARKTSKQVFVSYNLPNTSSSFELLVESRIKEEMQAFPEKF